MKLYSLLLASSISNGEKLGTLRGSGGTFFLPTKTTQKPVGEFQVNKRVGTVSGVYCDEIQQNPNYKMMCTDGNAEDSVKGCNFQFELEL